MKKFTRILMLAYSIMLLSPIAVLAQVDQTFWFVVPETTREHAKTPGVLRITAFQNAANVRISQPANPNFQPITLSVPAGTQQLVEFHDYGQNIKGYNSTGAWVEGRNVEPPRRGDGSLALELMLSAIENGTLDQVTWGGSVVLNHDWPGITGNEPSGVSSLEDMIFNKGLLIESTNGADISVYYEIANPRNPERFNLKGQNALGTEFLIPSQNQFMNYSGMRRSREKVDIVATEDGTVVTINYDRDLHNFVGKPSSGNSFSVTLDRGETFVLRSNTQSREQQLGGVFIESTKDIAVTISDDSIIESIKYIHYDLVGDQLIPNSIAGTRYIAMHPSHGTQYSNNYRINNSVSNQVFIWPVGNPTGIRINGEAVSNPNTGGETFSRGEHYRTNISANAILIDSDQPVIVYQISSYSYELGGGVLPALECTGSKSVTFARIYDEDFFIQIMTKKKNILDENGNNNFEVFYQDGTPATNEVFSSGDETSSGWQPVANSGSGDEQWYSFAKLANGLSTNNPITVKFKDAAKVDLDELFHLSVLDANGASMSYGYFSSYNSISIAGPKAICKEGDIIELRTNGVLVNWFSSANPTSPFAINTDIVEVTDQGEYWVESLNSACESSDRTSINYVIPRFELGDDGAACPGETIVLGLNEAFDFAAEYIWTINGIRRADLDGEHQISFMAEENTTYNVQLEVITAVEGLETCNYSQDVTINVGVTPNPDVLLNANEAICEGSELRAGFDPNLSYEWSFGGSVISDETYIIPAAAGAYTLRVYTEDGCELTQDINVTINPLPIVNLDDQMACPGVNGTFSVSGYPAGSSFRWYNGNTDTWTTPITGTGSTFLATEPIEEIIVEVTNNNACVAQDAASFGWHNEVVFPLGDQIICYSNELEVVISDQFEDYKWAYKADPTAAGDPVELTNPNQVAVGNVLTIQAESNTDAWSGRYYVTAQDNVNGCPVEGYFDLVIAPVPVFNLMFDKTADGRMCSGDTIKISFNDEPYNREFETFQWSYSSTGNPGSYNDIIGETFSWYEATTDGYYRLYGTMDNGCDAAGVTYVETVQSPEFELADGAACPGEDIVLSITDGTYFSHHGTETVPSRHEWITGIEGTEITGQVDILGTGATYTVDSDSRGSYRLTAYNGFGCFAARWADAVSYADIDFSLDNETICDNESYTLELPAGVTGVTYTWYEVIPGMEIELANNESWTINNKSAGTYTYKLVATSADGCTGEAEMTLTVLPAPRFTLEDGAICPGESISIEAQNSYASYTWNGIDGTNTYAVTAAGDVTLVVVDKNNCSATATANITIGTLPNVALNDIAICPDENPTLTVPYSSEDGYTILWTLPSGRTIRNESEIEVLRGEYSVTVYDAMGCSASASATVIWNDFPTVYFGPNIVDVCPVSLPVTIAAQGDIVNWVERLWHDGLYTGEVERIASLSDTVNVIRVRNAANCWSTASQSVLLALPTQYESGADIIACEPTDGFPFSVEFDAGQYTIYHDSTEEPQEVPIIGYRWYRGDTGEDLASEQIYTAIYGGEYVVEVFDGCWMHTDTFNVELFPNPVIAAIDTVIYRQVTVLAENGTQPYRYAINNGAPQDDKTFKNLPNGDYTVYVIDRNGCEDSMAFLFESSLNIEVPNFFTPNNDGFNDRWEIKGLEKLPESIIYIYDRYGKLLRKYSSTDPAWDGEYLNRPIAADDYWYVIHLLPIDKYYRGNFTLKR
jgi:gliding motility-associated-like protein